MKRVLITGAMGFIGRHCLPFLLNSGYQVHAVSSNLQQKSQSLVHWHQADLLNPARVADLMAQIQPTHLLHMAWYVVPGEFYTSLENYRWVQASLSLLQAFAKHGGRRVVMAGTCAEYDWQYGYCSEKVTPLFPSTLYGTCKHALQLMFDSYMKQTGLSGAWGRIFFLYGPYEHQNRLVSSVACSLLKREPAHCSHGNQIRDYLYIEDVADAFVSVLDSTLEGPVNIASGQPVTLKEIIGKIAEKAEAQHLIQLGAIPTSKNDPPLIVADVSRLMGELGWHPKYNLDNGLTQTIKWWEDQLKITELTTT